ncbi:MAG: AI-2E family transporter [Blastocatellia bacterium]
MNQNNTPATNADPRQNPLQWMRWIPAILLALGLGALLLTGSRVILIPLLVSLALTYLLEPVVEWFEKRGWTRPAAVLLTMTTASLLFILSLLFLLPGIWAQLRDSWDKLPLALQAGRQQIEPLLERLLTISPPAHAWLMQATSSLHDPQKQEAIRAAIAGWLGSGLLGLASATSSLLDLLLVPFFVYYLLTDYLRARVWIARLVPPRRRTTATGLLDQIHHVMSAYVRNQLLIAAVMGFLYSLGFAGLGVPLSFTLGMLSGFLNFVPYLGTLSGLTLALSFTALDGAGPWRLLGVVLVFLVVQNVEGFYLTPKLMGESLNLHPIWVLAGLVIAGNLFGLLGIILAVPAIAIARVLIRFLLDQYQKSAFYTRTGPRLLSAEGKLIELTDAAETDPAPDLIFTEESIADREARFIITTSELRHRPQDKPSKDNR